METDGFVLPNEGLSDPLNQFAVSVDSVESLTDIDFFSGLDDQIEDQLEDKIKLSDWGY